MVAGSLVFRDPPFMGTLAQNMRGSVAAVFAAANIRFGLHGFGMPYGPTFPYWSLSLEEQFYLILPVVILLARRHLALLLVVLIAVQLPLAHPRLYFFLRNDGLLWGVLLAASPILAGAAPAAAGWLARVPLGGPIVLLACVAVMTQLSPPLEQSPPYRLGAMAAAAAIPVWLAGANRDVFHAGPLQRAVLWLGSRSYALYLCHLPIYQCAAALARRGLPADFLFPDHIELRSAVIGVPLLLATADLTYRGVETPLRRYGIRLSCRLISVHAS
jgi:peptidoglycan/LPS O-acetylase OafA/YrhL